MKFKTCKKIKIYSSITGGKDKKRNDVEIFSGYNKFKQPVMNAKIYKVLPHLFFKAEYSIWVDGNAFLKVKPKKLIQMLGNKDIGVFPHPTRTNIYDEAIQCKRVLLDDIAVIDKQITRYKIEGFNDKNLGACFIIVRKHTKEIERLNEQWWAEICRGSTRDQISFPYVFRDKVKYFPLQKDISNNKYFTRVEHNK